MFQETYAKETYFDTESHQNTARFGSQSDSETRVFSFGGHPTSKIYDSSPSYSYISFRNPIHFTHNPPSTGQSVYENYALPVLRSSQSEAQFKKISMSGPEYQAMQSAYSNSLIVQSPRTNDNHTKYAKAEMQPASPRYNIQELKDSEIKNANEISKRSWCFCWRK